VELSTIVRGCTARREQAGHKRGGWHWKAYRKQQGKLFSTYLGKADVLTLDRLNAAVQTLAQRAVRDAQANADEEVPPPAPASQPGDSLTSLLATKLHIPRPRTPLVQRSHLVERLQRGAERPLTLVSAPCPGYLAHPFAKGTDERSSQDSNTVHRLLKPRSPLDCPACRLASTLSSVVKPAPPPVRPWRELPESVRDLISKR
jgi:hypothetical protein